MRANNPEDKVRQLQRRLRSCAKRSNTLCFHALFVLFRRGDVPWEAWKRSVRDSVHATPLRPSVSRVQEICTHGLKGGAGIGSV